MISKSNHLFQPILVHSILSIFSFLTILVPPSYCLDYHEQLSACSRQYLYRCGSSTLNISYPFWGGDRAQHCGRKEFEIKCQDNQYHYIEPAGSQKFRVLRISYTQPIINIARYDLWNDTCPGIFEEIYFNRSLFEYGPNVRQLWFFHDCDEPISHRESNYLSCNVTGEDKNGFYTNDTLELHLANLSNSCKQGIKVPVLLGSVQDLKMGHLGQALKQGFDLDYSKADIILCAKCLATHGTCASNHSNPDQFICLCPFESQPHTCPVRLLAPPAPVVSPGMHDLLLTYYSLSLLLRLCFVHGHLPA